jgi:hypothetical protein
MVDDFLKFNLYWDKIYTGRTNSCVFVKISNLTANKQFDPVLGMADCGERKKFVCEVQILHSAMRERGSEKRPLPSTFNCLRCLTGWRGEESVLPASPL